MNCLPSEEGEALDWILSCLLVFLNARTLGIRTIWLDRGIEDHVVWGLDRLFCPALNDPIRGELQCGNDNLK